MTNKYYIGSAHGEIYGLDHDVARFSPDVVMSLRPETDVAGLYLTGQSQTSFNRSIVLCLSVGTVR